MSSGHPKSPGSDHMDRDRAEDFSGSDLFLMEEIRMQSKLMLSLAAGTAVMLCTGSPNLSLAQAQAPSAITGQVSSEAEGAMEGVVVTAKKPGGKVSVSVITDAQGRYSFPADRLEPGQYALTIRAVGYDLTGKPTADVAVEKTAAVDLKLDKTKS